MIYAFPQYYESKNQFQTYAVVYKALVDAGHTVIADIHSPGCDVVAVSLCDVLDMKYLRKIRNSTTKPVLAGGAYAYNYWSAKLYADYVWIGEVYDMAECRTLNELADSPHCYTGDDSKRLYASWRVDWDRVPVTRVAKHKSYYWAGVGCKNKCAFCYTSWTHRHLVNTEENQRAARRLAKKHNLYLMMVSNEYEINNENLTKDMLLRDYIRQPISGNMVRCGVEFATEKNRREKGKPITRNELFCAIQKMNVDRLTLRLFHITGYEPQEDWEMYIDELCMMILKAPNKSLLHLMFNNLQYQNYTPLYRERFDIDEDKYITHKDAVRWYDKLRLYTPHALMGPPSPFQHVACRMGQELATTLEQEEYWQKMMSRKNKYSVKEFKQALLDTGVLETEERHIDFNTGEIRLGSRGQQRSGGESRREETCK